jgi:hypothetical protein
MNSTFSTTNYTISIVNELEALTGKPVSINKRCELQSMLLQWFYSVKDYTKNED